MTRRQLFKELNALCRKLDNEWDINCGGCCYVSYVLSKYLEEYNIPFTIRRYYREGCHYAIEVSDRCLNRAGYKEDYIISNSGSDALLEIYRMNNWNSRYNVKHNSAVHLKIKAIFNKYGNSIRRLCPKSSS